MCSACRFAFSAKNYTHPLLLPLSWLYGVGVEIRNRLYDKGVLKTTSPSLPTICVGNLSVGGTGKTPHVEYLIRLLSPRYRVAVLSRGYRRKSRGYLLAHMDTPMEQVGDEPWQMKQKFGDEIHVAVDANRPEGIRRLQENKETSDTQVVLLDDAFQHRAIKAGLNILLMDCHRLICDDWLLPAGRLREPAKGANRADVVVVTKCPPDIKPMDCRVIRTKLRLRPHQQLFFSTLRYDRLQALFGNDTRTLEQIETEKTSVLLVTGIASPHQMEQDLRPYASRITPLPFPDHHYYTAQDVRHICQALETLPTPRIIITTEKDATRLQGLQGLTPEARESLYVLPIRVEILQERNTKLNQIIEDYVRQNS